MEYCFSDITMKKVLINSLESANNQVWEIVGRE